VFDQQNDKFEFICEVRSMSDITCHSVVVKTMIGHDDRTIHVSIPYMKDTIPVGILFKALGFNTTEEFSDFVGLKCPEIDKYIRFILRDSFCNDVNYAMLYLNRKSEHGRKNAVRTEHWSTLPRPR
jgi:DNA-directed RNA polymerase beta subunit